MSQFEPTGPQIAREVDLERYGDPEKARMRAALGAISVIAMQHSAGRSATYRSPVYAAIDKTDQLARQGLAP